MAPTRRVRAATGRRRPPGAAPNPAPATPPPSQTVTRSRSTSTRPSAARRPASATRSRSTVRRVGELRDAPGLERRHAHAPRGRHRQQHADADQPLRPVLAARRLDRARRRRGRLREHHTRTTDGSRRSAAPDQRGTTFSVPAANSAWASTGGGSSRTGGPYDRGLSLLLERVRRPGNRQRGRDFEHRSSATRPFVLHVVPVAHDRGREPVGRGTVRVGITWTTTRGSSGSTTLPMGVCSARPTTRSSTRRRRTGQARGDRVYPRRNDLQHGPA